MPLSRKLTFSFTIAILISIFIISFISNTMINRKFDSYLIEEQNMKFEKIRKDINNLFLEEGNNLTSRDISNYASMEGIYIEIRDYNDDLICHSNNSNMMHRGMMGHMMRQMMRRHGMRNSNMDTGKYVEKTFSLLDRDNVVGTLIIGYIDNSYLTESALIFKDTLSISFIISGIITIILGFIISILLSKGLSRPLVNITKTANEMRSGNLKYRSAITTNTEEIQELSHSINYLAETLEKQEGLRKKYASDIAHELRTPLTTLKSHVEAILDGVWEPTDEHLTILLTEIDRLAKLVDDLKNTFKTLEAELNISKTHFNISEELKDILSQFKPLFKKENFLLESSIEEDIEIIMDKNRFKQIMNNLLSNALKFLKDRGKVFVTLIREKDQVKITVEDNGIGIKEEDLPFLFDRFYRANVSRNKDTGGTGLGLSITKTLVEAHGGSIYVESEFDKGTRFTILLPTDTKY
ncbi:HAMP domain-containing sensor histidine kinase [Schnuerera ultunensis]|uniref:HAMP domain-containing sensor histidine kinase n=1 Tax=Schnuerera ultunensis TaxID=45497 RepID=UPI0003F958CB|nr:ATP-binding protein [Schnuerera ultunensis]